MFSGALSSFPIDVEYYRVAIFFDEAGNVEEYGDFGYYASEAMNELLGSEWKPCSWIIILMRWK